MSIHAVVRHDPVSHNSKFTVTIRKGFVPLNFTRRPTRGSVVARALFAVWSRALSNKDIPKISKIENAIFEIMQNFHS
jgi:hypothetical protein